MILQQRTGLAWPAAVGLLALAALASVATSYVPHATHEPVYMSWEAFRHAARVVPPRPIRKRGKIYKWGRLLLTVEPGEGVHVIDNTHPAAPVPRAFIEAPGAMDVAARGHYLYLDSFVDLLVFEVRHRPFTVRFVSRLPDVFPYTYWQTVPARSADGRRVWPRYPDRRKGVVVGWKPIEEKQP